MAKAYEPQGIEDALYQKWMESGYFNPDNLSGDPYTIMMPPPNVTGVLHLGHALENSLMDAMARYQRLQGKKVLFVPGTDHAAIATQAKVEKLLIEKGIKHPRQQLGRDGLVDEIKKFAEQSKATILNQVQKVGSSCDWSRLAYTFDDQRNAAVKELFVRMYNDGLIYRGYRVVNWSVKGQSTCSDDEIVTIERPSVLYTFKYSKDFPIRISSTRPETKLGDTAVAVHPTDKRYKKFVGQTFIVDVGAAQPLSIRVIADENVDPKFGTGALGVTPAHSAIDFAMYEKQKAAGQPIGIVQVIGADGRMTAEAGSYAGLKAEEAREKFVEWLRANALLENEEETVQNVGTSDRYGDVIEAIPMTQWWLDMNKTIPKRGKTLRDLMREAVTTGLDGNTKQRVAITPERFEKLYLDRVENLRDWCLSRQLWWGHRIPAWYRGEEIFVGTEAPEGEGWIQDEDTLDTWFSSGTWTFSTLGWPEKTPDLKTYHPTSWITMGYEILYLWLMRMILTSAYALDEIPFTNAYIHGILRDKDGKKFSKSSGNGIDPIEVIGQYGCDSLRVSLLSGISPGNDSRYYTEKIEGSRNLVNKLWNVSRFIGMSTGSLHHVDSIEPKTLADRWILARFADTQDKVEKLMEQFDFSLATEILRDFTWSDFADWYLEIAKIEGEKNDILNYLLERLLILWHPFMPFVTEEIYQQYDRGLIIVAEWPRPIEYQNLAHQYTHLSAIDELRDVVGAIRNLRSKAKMEPKVTVDIKLIGGESMLEQKRVIEGLTRSCLEWIDTKPEKAIGAVVGRTEIFMLMPSMMNLDELIGSTEKLIKNKENFVQSLEKKLSNQEFIQNAPEELVAAQSTRLFEERAELQNLKDMLTFYCLAR